MRIEDGYRAALKRCGCCECVAELEQLDAHLAKATAVPGGDDITVTVVEPLVHDGKVGHGKHGPIYLDHKGTGRTYPKRSPNYGG